MVHKEPAEIASRTTSKALYVPATAVLGPTHPLAHPPSAKLAHSSAVIAPARAYTTRRGINFTMMRKDRRAGASKVIWPKLRCIRGLVIPELDSNVPSSGLALYLLTWGLFLRRELVS